MTTQSLIALETDRPVTIPTAQTNMAKPCFLLRTGAAGEKLGITTVAYMQLWNCSGSPVR